MMIGPTLKICDFGFGPHTLRVGTNECLPTTVSNLRIVFGRPIHLHATINSCGYQEEMGTACRLYLRVVDTDGKPVPDVDFSPGMATDKTSRTDSYRRYQTLIGGRCDLTFTEEGFEPATARVVCPDVKASMLIEEIDQQVVMTKLR